MTNHMLRAPGRLRRRTTIGFGVAMGLLLVLGTVTDARADASQAETITQRGVVAFQAPDSHLWISDYLGVSHDLGYLVMPGTNPSISATSLFGQIVDRVGFQGPNGTLWLTQITGVGRDLGFPMRPGTSPSVSPDGTTVAFQGSNGTLWTLVGSRIRDLGYPMMAGTSPDVVNGRLVFQGANGHLWSGTPTGGGVDLGQPMMAGTSPAVANIGTMAFHGSNGNLMVVRFGRVRDTRIPMAAGTSPSVAADGTDDLTRVAVQGANGNLWTTVTSLDGIGDDQGQPMMAGTSPVISPDADQIAWHGANDHLQFMTGTRTRDLSYLLMPGTNPG